MGAWIEILISYFFRFCKSMSHPSRVRGLKFKSLIPRNLSNCSHPTWVRDLKSMLRFLAHTLSENRPCTGATVDWNVKILAKEIYKNLIYITASNGMKITNKSKHFILLVIWSAEQKRSDINIKDVLDVFQKSNKIRWY